MLETNNVLELIRKAKKGDEKAKEELFLNNLPLIKSIIKRFKSKGVEYDDLYQIASIGFIKAITNFDESFNVKFSTYTVPMIIGEIKRYIRDNGAIKVSRSIKILANKINRFIDEYNTLNNSSPTIEYVANKFNVTEQDVVIALDSAKMPLSIYDKFDDDEEGQELVEKIPNGIEEEQMIDKITLISIIEKLSEKSECYKEVIMGLETKILEKIRQKF